MSNTPSIFRKVYPTLSPFSWFPQEVPFGTSGPLGRGVRLRRERFWVKLLSPHPSPTRMTESHSIPTTVLRVWWVVFLRDSDSPGSGLTPVGLGVVNPVHHYPYKLRGLRDSGSGPPRSRFGRGWGSGTFEDSRGGRSGRRVDERDDPADVSHTDVVSVTQGR